MFSTKEEVLQACTVEGNVVKLPSVQLDRKLYQDTAKALQLIGGKWVGGKVFGFVFPSDPTELLEQVAKGDKRNLKKEFQFFGTSDKEADQLVYLAKMQSSHKVLEPSAGQGALIKAIHREFPKMVVDYCELMDINRIFPNKLENVHYVGDDFLTLHERSDVRYDRIIANPPFSNNQDIEHVRAMYRLLKPNGRLVAITSRHWEMSNNRKETEFRAWFEKHSGDRYEIESGAFKESGTSVATFIIVIVKDESIVDGDEIKSKPKKETKTKSETKPVASVEEEMSNDKGLNFENAKKFVIDLKSSLTDADKYTKDWADKIKGAGSLEESKKVMKDFFADLGFDVKYKNGGNVANFNYEIGGL